MHVAIAGSKPRDERVTRLLQRTKPQVRRGARGGRLSHPLGARRICAALVRSEDAAAAALSARARFASRLKLPRAARGVARAMGWTSVSKGENVALMKYRNLGAAGVKVSELCLGAMTFGEADAQSFMHQVGSDEATSYSVLNRALELGINFVDTADVYGQDGLSERIIGNWFDKDKRRDEVVLATKFRFSMGSGPNRTGASRFRIRSCVEASLRRLRTDRIDLYQIHMQDRDTPEEETLRALDDLVTQGKVLYIGCSNYAAYRLMDSLWRSETGGLARYVTLQAEYSLVVRDLEREHVPLCRERGLGILPWSPLAGGFLSGKYDKDQPPPAGARLEKWKDRLARYDNERCWRTLAAVKQVAAELETTPSAVALAWLLRQPQVTSTIFGARSITQLEENVKAAEVQLSDEQLSRLGDASNIDLGYPYAFIKSIQGRW